MSRDLGVTDARLSQWHDEALASARAGLKSRARTSEADEIRRLKAIIGDRTVRLEIHREGQKLLREKLGYDPFEPRRSSN